MTALPQARHLRLTADGRLDDPVLLASPPLQQLLGLLGEGGEAARVVGGAVRNSLLGLPVSDIDIATTAEPAEVMRRAKAARLRTIPTGLAHGTVTVMVGGAAFEVTTLRRDVETDGRHAVVRFSRDFAEDAQRRDFTINALSVDADGALHDSVGGLDDLAGGRVRFIGEADRRITEDYLRILRFFRFHACYGEGPLDPEGLAASVRHRDALARLSRERIRAELLKLLIAPRAVPVFAVMEAAGIGPLVLGAPGEPQRLARLADLEAGFGLHPDAVLRLAALAVRRAADADRLRLGLRLSNQEWRRLAEAAAARDRLDPDHPPDRAGCLELLFICGERAATDGVLLAHSDAGTALDAAWVEALRIIMTEPRPTLPVGGADVAARGVKDGRRIGAVLKLLQASWIRAGFPRDPAILSGLIDDAVATEAAVPPTAGREMA